MTFEEFTHRYFDHYDAGDYASALALFEDIDFDGYRSVLRMWQITALTLAGRIDDALGVLTDTLDEGHSYDPSALANDPDLDALRQEAAWDELSARNAEQWVVEELTPLMYIYVDRRASSNCVLVLPDDLGSLISEKHRWQHYTSQTTMVALTQSVQRGWASDSYVWGDMERAVQQIEFQINQLKERHELVQALILVGFGRSADVVLRAMAHPDVRGAIVFDPDMAQDYSDTFPDLPRDVFIFASKRYENRAQELAESLERHKDYLVKLTLTDKAYHSYPEDMRKIISSVGAHVDAFRREHKQLFAQSSEE